MSLIPETQYPGKIKPASAAYPYGEARNITLPNDGTGTPWEAALVNDLFGFQQALLQDANIVPSGSPDEVGNSQYLEALKKITVVPVANKAAAQAVTPVANKALYILSEDGRGNIWRAVVGLAINTINDDSVNFCGTEFRPTSGDGSSGWVSDNKGVINIDTFGGFGDDSTNNSDAFIEADAITDVIIITSGVHQINTNTTISATVKLLGGQLRIASGVTFICGVISADNQNIIFLGDGTVKANDSKYSLGWYEGDFANNKWDFLRRGLIADDSYHLIIPRPKTDDPAAIDKGAGNGVMWALDAPMEFGDPENFVTIELLAGFSAEPSSGSLTSMWHFGTDLIKTEMITVIGQLRLRGSLGADVGLLVTAAAHIDIPWVYCDVASGVKIESNLQASNDIKIGHIYGTQGVALDIQTISASGRVSEIDVGYIDSDGGSTTVPECLVRLKGGVRGVNIGHVSMHAVTGGFSDASVALVLIENNSDNIAPANGIKIDKVTNRSATITADAVKIRDNTSGAGSKISGVSIHDVYTTTGNAVDLAYCVETNVYDVKNGNVLIGPDVNDTQVFGTLSDAITDSGERTRVNGRIRYSLSLANNTATNFSIPPELFAGVGITVASVSATNQFSGVVLAEFVTGTCHAISGGVNFNTTVNIGLFGTTGAVGKVTVSARSGDGRFYIENRSGAALDIFVELAG